VTGASGQLGRELMRAYSVAGATVVPLSRPGFSLEAPEVPAAVDVVVNAAAWTDVDGCARHPDRALALNGAAPGCLARLAYEAGMQFIQISTNEVFDGASQAAYAEDDVPRPVNPYGASKLAGERAVREAHPTAAIVRSAWIYGGPQGFPAKIVNAGRVAAQAGRPLNVVVDEVGNPTPAASLADRLAALTMRDEAMPLVLHLAGDPPASRHDWATQILLAAHLPSPAPISLRDYSRDSSPPPHAVLDTSLARSLGLGIEWDVSPFGASHGADD
jgi:dTDP-4-dehydrorhamnose reductase